jgi:hypothetical protein
MMIVRGNDPLVNSEKFELDPGKGVINIGSDAENDIVIQHPSVRPFHMMLSYTEKPYQIIPLDPEAEISIRGVTVRSETAIPVTDLNEVRFGDFSFAQVVEGADGSDVESFSIIAIPEEEPQEESGALPAPLMFSTQDVSAPVFLTPAGQPVTPEPDEEIQDEVILVELIENEQTVAVEQTALFQLGITNGGPIVAAFDVAVEGVPAEWVTILPPRVNLFEGGRAGVTISITPPRKPTSSAGAHPLRFTVTSPNHAGRKTIKLATLNIEPYQDFSISDVAPMRKVIPFRKRYGAVEMEVRNRGNAPAHLRLMAQDDGNECQFQFLAPNGLMQLAQVEYTLPAGETQLAPIHIAPLRRSIVRFTPSQHPYRVSVTQTENETLSLFTMGTAIAKPLFGILEILLTMLILAGITFFLFTPRIINFQADNSIIGLGESTTLRWRTFFATHDLSITGIDEPVNSSNGEIEIFPTETVNTYQLSATTWLWKMLNLEPRQRAFTVLAVPNEPSINTFMVGDNDVLVGDSVLLRWSITNADKVILTVNGVSDVFENPEDFNGERNLFIDSNTLISLEAINALGTAVDSEYILARPPTIVIKRFEVDKTTIYKGEQVTILWEIDGTGMEDGGEVRISAFDSPLPLEGELTFFPEESMEFVLTVSNRKAKEVRILPVGVLDPDEPPVAPTINFFKAAPDTLVGAGEVELAWSVTGMFQDISIKNGEETIASGLSAQGFRTIDVEESGTYVLTAVNSDQSAGKDLTITVNPALLKARLSVSAISKTDSLSIGSKTIVSIIADAPSAGDPPPTGTVVVSDGTASCTISLPVTSCEMEFSTPGNKLITATYMGDSNYIQSESDPYTPSFYVMGNDLEIQISFTPSAEPYFFGQKVDLRVFATGSNPIRNPLGTVMLKRVCDSTANYLEPCAATQEGIYTLTAADGGLHIFEDLVIDQLGGNYGLQVIYTSDDYYDDKYTTVYKTVDGTILSPLSFSYTTGSLTPPYDISAPIPFNVTVTDDNPSALYAVPKGYATVSALHSDGTTRVTCAPEQAHLTAVDGRSSRTTCTLTLTQAGQWTVSADFTPVSDIWHTDESDVLGTVAVNTGTNITLLSPPASLTTYAETALSLNVLRTDFNSQVSTGALACSATSSTCTCSYDEDDTVWKCTVKPSVASVTGSTSRSVNFTYTPVVGQFLNSSSKSQTFSIVKANTTASMASPASLASYYIVGATLDVTIDAVHAAGGDDPSGTNNVTIQLGSGTCNASTGMSAPIAEVTTSLDTPRTFNLGSSYNTGSEMRFCYRYNGDGANGAYNASAWAASSAFLVRNTMVNLTVTTQPTAALTVGGSASVTVAVVNGESGANPTSGDIEFKLGSGTCNSSSGMTTGVIGTIPNGTLTGGNSLTKTVTLTNDHAIGADIRFCMRYAGSGSYGASSWVASTAFRVKAQPAIGAVSPATVAVVLSPNMDDYTEFTFPISNGVSLAPAQITVVDGSNTVICQGGAAGNTITTTNYKCQYVSVTSGTYKFQIASKLPGTITLTPKYTADERNLAATGTAFTVDARYEVTWVNQPALSNGIPLTWIAVEQADTLASMVTGISAKFSITNYSGYDNGVFELTPRVMKIINSVDQGLFSTTLSGCVINADFSVGCAEAKIDDSQTTAIRLVLQPSTGKAAYYTTSQLSSGYHTISVTANVLQYDGSPRLSFDCPEEGTDPAIRYFTITGLTDQQLPSAIDFSKGDFQLQLECVYEAAEDWCYDFFSGSGSPVRWTDAGEECKDEANYSNVPLTVQWLGIVEGLNQFKLTIKDNSFTGCAGRGGIIQTDIYARFYYGTGGSDYQTFEFVVSDDTNDRCN